MKDSIVELFKKLQTEIIEQCRESQWRDQSLFRLQESIWWYKSSPKIEEKQDG